MNMHTLTEGEKRPRLGKGRTFKGSFVFSVILHKKNILIYCVLSPFSCVQLFVSPWTVACQAPLSMGFSMQEYWNGLPCPSINVF